MKTNKDNPETLQATLGKQDTGWRQTRRLSLFVFIMCLVFPMLPVVSPDCPIVIVPSVFFIVYLNTEICFDSKFRSKTYKKTRHRMKTNKDNPETLLATLGKQDIGWKQTRTIRRHYWQHWENKKQDEDKQGQSGDTTGNIGKTRQLSLFVFIMCLVFPMLPVVSLDCPCLSSSYGQTRAIRRHYWQHWENRTQDEDKQGQSGDTTGNIGKTRHRMKTNVCLHHVSCFPNVGSSVSGLSNRDCLFGFLYCLFKHRNLFR
jgi:nitrate reductase NapE component